MSTTAVDLSPTTSRKGLHISLWVVQGLLGFAFLAAGAMKATAPVADLAAAMPWVSGAMGDYVRFIGVSEFLGGLGLVLPAATRIKPWLTPLAAFLLAVVMVLAAVTHGVRGELDALPVNLVLGGLAAFVAWGRAVAVPIQERA